MRSAVSTLYGPIEPDLTEVERRLLETATHEQSTLRAVLEDVLLTPGKRVRPALAIASGRLFQGSPANLCALAAAVEYLHTATLIHDDVVDQANSRRGAPALYTVVGNSVSVLVGDYLFAQAAATASETNNLWIMRLFAEAVMTLCAGQIEESSRRGDARWLDRDSYYRTIEAKTAALFVLACRGGGIIGGASMDGAQALARYGRCFGLAFQIVDDILDLVGDEAAMGKPVGSDLRQGVITLPVIYLRDEIPESTFRQAFDGGGARDEAIQAICNQARTSRALNHAQDEARALAEEAVAELGALPAGEHRDLLAEIVRATVVWQA